MLGQGILTAPAGGGRVTGFPVAGGPTRSVPMSTDRLKVTFWQYHICPCSVSELCHARMFCCFSNIWFPWFPRELPPFPEFHICSPGYPDFTDRSFERLSPLSPDSIQVSDVVLPPISRLYKC